MKRVVTILWQTGAIGLLCASMIVMPACTTDEVLSTIDAALQTASSLSAAVGAVSPVDGAAITLLTGLATKGIQAIQTAYDTYEKNKTTSNLQNVAIAAQAIQTNLPQELASVRISDATTVTKVTNWVNLVTVVAEDVVQEINAVQANNPHGIQPHASVKMGGFTPEEIQFQWQTKVCQGDAACGALVHPHHKHARKVLGVF